MENSAIDRAYKMINKIGGMKVLESLADAQDYITAYMQETKAEYFDRMRNEEEMHMNQIYKADAGKPRLSLVPASLERAVAEIRAGGVEKYGGGAENWREVAVERYFDALLRHVNSMRQDGLNAVDQESGCKHVHHVACNVAFIIELLETQNAR